ncbi:MAG: RDD family protein [Tindallia sp. MSAO_Bac2]|nr:MAG: RDD family protein [Tindallia sp. MSAO_Bac2]
MSAEWYLAKNGQSYGPYTWEQMLQYVAEKRITSQDYVRSQQMNEWKIASEIPGLIRGTAGFGGKATPGAASLGVRQSADGLGASPTGWDAARGDGGNREIRISGGLEYVGLGPRIIAQLIDSVIFLVLGGIVMYISFQRMIASYQYGMQPSFPFMTYFLLMVAGVLYYVLMEGLVGATLGKMAMGIQVRKLDGSLCGIGPAAVRNVLRIVDALPTLYIVGIILISNSPMNQRLGDRVANTVVVKKDSI